jgi:hypothetical protein
VELVEQEVAHTACGVVMAVAVEAQAVLEPQVQYQQVQVQS